jgi:hypothetical protein
MKPPKRKTSIFASDSKPLVTFALTPQALAELPFMREWGEQLIQDVVTNGMAGVDAVVVSRVQDNGGNLTALLAAKSRANEKGSKKKKGGQDGNGSKGGQTPSKKRSSGSKADKVDKAEKSDKADKVERSGDRSSDSQDEAKPKRSTRGSTPTTERGRRPKRKG